jgi:hypothetical protein
VRWLRVAFDDVVFAITLVVRPWTDLRAVKTTQADIVKAVARQHDDLAKATALVDSLSHELTQMKVRVTEQEAGIRELQAAVTLLQRGSASGLSPVPDTPASTPSLAPPESGD